MKIIGNFFNACLLLQPTIYKDERGYFYESFNQKKFNDLVNLDIQFVQDNQVLSSYGVIRGLHIQRPPFSQAKLIRVLEGKILDIAVDVRFNSPTYGQFIAVELSDKNQQQLFIPHGFLHGYSVLSETALVMYKCDAFYNKEAEDSVSPFDQDLKIDWQIPVSKAVISEKDKQAKTFCEFNPIDVK